MRKRHNLLTLVPLLAACLLSPASCRGRVRERIEERHEKPSESRETDSDAELQDVHQAEVTFHYEEEPLVDAMATFEAGTLAERALLDSSYTLYSLAYDSEGERVPGLFAVPNEGQEPFPAVLLLHGHNSSRAYMIRRYAPALAELGIASIAIDLPLQGERRAEGEDFFSGDPQTTARTMQRAVIDTRRAMDWLRGREYVDMERVGVIGYSLGSWIATMTAAADERLDAVALNVMGQEETAAVSGEWEQFMQEHPRLERWVERRGLDLSQEGYKGLLIERWIADISPRPLLMLNGRDDRIVPASGAEALYEAAEEPKEILWYDTGHILLAEATDDCVEWIADKLAGD